MISMANNTVPSMSSGSTKRLAPASPWPVSFRLHQRGVGCPIGSFALTPTSPQAREPTPPQASERAGWLVVAPVAAFAPEFLKRLRRGGQQQVSVGIESLPSPGVAHLNDPNCSMELRESLVSPSADPSQRMSRRHSLLHPQWRRRRTGRRCAAVEPASLIGWLVHFHGAGRACSAGSQGGASEAMLGGDAFQLLLEEWLKQLMSIGAEMMIVFVEKFLMARQLTKIGIQAEC
jgi:hypothetical protein